MGDPAAIPGPGGRAGRDLRLDRAQPTGQPLCLPPRLLDGYEREFRGFGMVEQWDTEEFRDSLDFNDGEFLNWDQQSWSPPVLTRTWFHTGAFEEAPTVPQQYLGEYWTEPALRPAARAADAAAMRLPDTVLPDGLDPYEIQE